MTAIALLLLLAPPEVSTAPTPAAPPAKLKLVFLGFQPEGGVTEEEAKALSATLQSELGAIGAYDVISQADLATMLGIERQKQLMGCSEASSSCMSELAGALNSSRAITGTLSRVDADVSVNISLIDPLAAVALGRVGRRVEGGAAKLGLAHDALRPMAYDLVNQDPQFKDQPFSAPRGFGGFTLGVRGELEAFVPSASPVVFAEYAWRYLGVMLGVIATNNPGARLEVRVFPFTLWKLRPHLAVGSTAFLTGVALRAAVGVTLGLGHLQVVLDGAFEHFFPRPGYAANAVLIAAGLGWLF